METKTLNLNFTELEPQEGSSNVCLMPCPCSSAQSYPSTTYQGVGGGKGALKSIGEFFGDLVDPSELNKGENCMIAITELCGKYGISDADCKAAIDCACLDNCETGNSGGK